MYVHNIRDIITSSSDDPSAIRHEDTHQNRTKLLDHRGTRCCYWWPFRYLKCDCRTDSKNKGLVRGLISIQKYSWGSYPVELSGYIKHVFNDPQGVAWRRLSGVGYCGLQFANIGWVCWVFLTKGFCNGGLDGDTIWKPCQHDIVRREKLYLLSMGAVGCSAVELECWNPPFFTRLSMISKHSLLAEYLQTVDGGPWICDGYFQKKQEVCAFLRPEACSITTICILGHLKTKNHCREQKGILEGGEKVSLCVQLTTRHELGPDLCVVLKRVPSCGQADRSRVSEFGISLGDIPAMQDEACCLIHKL
jgi:hypothetical protein